MNVNDAIAKWFLSLITVILPMGQPSQSATSTSFGKCTEKIGKVEYFRSQHHLQSPSCNQCVSAPMLYGIEQSAPGSLFVAWRECR